MSTPVITLVERDPELFRVHFARNDVEIGEIVKAEDGFFVFFGMEGQGGFWEAYVLRAIADKLDEMNAPWAEQIKNDPALQ